jgi:hypothetical protein
MNRRELLLAVPALAAAKTFAHPIGLNLYTVRGPLAKNPAETYQSLGKIGIKLLEVRPVQLLQHAAMIRDAGMKPVHMFIETAAITGAWDEWRGFMTAMAEKMKMPVPASFPKTTLAEMIELAKKHGVQRIGTSMLLPGERTAATIDLLNKASEQCRAAGLELYYHNHAFEFDGPRGQRFLDQLHKGLDRQVRLELDIFWATVGGDSAADVLKQWKGRVRSIHLKDVAPDAPLHPKETDVPPSAFRELGKGKLDLKAILKQAEKSGVEHYFIELDYSPGDPLESVRNCYRYLKTEV